MYTEPMPIDVNGTTIYSTAELAAALGVTKRQIAKLCVARKIDCRRFGRQWIIPKSTYDKLTAARDND